VFSTLKGRVRNSQCLGKLKINTIAVGMACSFAPHNLGTIVKAIEAYIKNDNITHEELLEIVGGPDFPTGGLVINKDELIEGYKTGRGKIRIRGKYKIEKRGTKELIVFYEIPYMTKKSKIAEDIAKLAENKEIEGISDVRDESDKEMALVIEVKKGFSPDDIANILFAKTQLENTYSINNTCLVNGKPKTLSFKELIEHYVAFQQEVITRRTEFDLNKILARIEIINGLIIALANIDEVIELIKKSDSTALASIGLQKRFLLNENQAKAVLAMKLSSLTRLEIEELKKEKLSLEKEKEKLEKILNCRDTLNNVLITELKQFANPYIVPRRTEIINITVEKSKKEKLAKKIENVNISINEDSIVSFVTEKQFKNRVNRENSVYRIATNTGESLIIFMSSGIIFRVPVKDLQAGDSLHRVLNLNPQDKIINILTDNKKEFIVFLTKQGMFKKTRLSEYQNIRRTGVIGIRLRDGDEVVAIDFVDQEPVIVMSSAGNCIRFRTDNISATGRNSMGVISIKLGEGETAVDFSVDSEDKDYFITVTKNGFVKKTVKTEYPMQGRNGKGVIGVKLQDGDEAFAIEQASDSDQIIFYGTRRLVKASVKEISAYSRASAGNKLVKDGTVTNVHLV
jgi:DNA gyrase subunit A